MASAWRMTLQSTVASRIILKCAPGKLIHRFKRSDLRLSLVGLLLSSDLFNIDLSPESSTPSFSLFRSVSYDLPKTKRVFVIVTASTNRWSWNFMLHVSHWLLPRLLPKASNAWVPNLPVGKSCATRRGITHLKLEDKGLAPFVPHKALSNWRGFAER